MWIIDERKWWKVNQILCWQKVDEKERKWIFMENSVFVSSSRISSEIEFQMISSKSILKLNISLQLETESWKLVEISSILMDRLTLLLEAINSIATEIRRKIIQTINLNKLI